MVYKIVDLLPVIYTDDIKAAVDDRKKLAKNINKQFNGVVKMDIISLERGTASIESCYDEALNTPYILEKAEWAEKKGYHGIVIDCYGDPGIDAVRERVRIPVAGANHAANFLAVQIAKRFSIVNILPETEPILYDLINKYGLNSHLASIETIDIPVLELEKHPRKTVEKAYRAAKKAITEKGAYAIVLGCTGMSGLADAIERKLRKDGIEVPVIEPLRAAIYTLISWIMAGKTHSKRAYPPPRKKLRRI